MTEAELVAAATDATSMGELLRRLGLPDRSDKRRRIRSLLGDEAPDASPLPLGADGRRARRSYTDEQLLAALAEARNFGELCERLGLRPKSGTHRRLREDAERLDVPIPAHWSRPGPIGEDGVRRRPPRYGPPKPPPARFDPHELRAAVAGAFGVAEAIRALGYEPSSMTRRWLMEDVRRHSIDISHFRARPRGGGRTPRPLVELRVEGRRVSSHGLRQRLILEGLKLAQCEVCMGTRWNGKPIPLELDHVDGDRANNLLENLRLLCPNCHALTPTYRGRNIGRRSGTSPAPSREPAKP